jgi:soluble lytic murein transglycosylase-like protein
VTRRDDILGNLLRLLLFALTLTAGWLAGVVPARADVYAWRDKDGRLVLSDRPAAATTAPACYAVYGNDAIRTTRAIATATRADMHSLIDEHAALQSISPDLVRAVIQVESAWNPRAVSAKGALGLMQLMPATAAELGVVNPFDPSQNIRAGVKYLKRLLDRYDGNTELALAAYNAGPTAVDRYGRVPPYRETQAYVRRIISVTAVRIGPGKLIYKIVELIDGREVPRYSDRKPAGDYALVTRR